MKPENVLAGLPGALERESISFAILAAFKRREIGFDDYSNQNALWVAEHLCDYVPRRYPDMSGHLHDYVMTRRASGPHGRGADPSLSRHLGIWTDTVRRLETQNEADLSLLRWAATKCMEIGSEEKAVAVAEHMKVYFEHPLPRTYAPAVQVQGMDARDIQRTKRGNNE